MFKNIKVHKKRKNSETIFHVTEEDGKNYLYRGTQLLEILKDEREYALIVSFIGFLGLHWIISMLGFLNFFTSASIILLIVMMNIIDIKRVKKLKKIIIQESDGMIEKIHSQPKDMTHYKTEEETS
jgi:hypothetical protein